LLCWRILLILLYIYQKFTIPVHHTCSIWWTLLTVDPVNIVYLHSSNIFCPSILVSCIILLWVCLKHEKCLKWEEYSPHCYTRHDKVTACQKATKSSLYHFVIICWHNCQQIIFALTWRKLTKLDRKIINTFFPSTYFQCTPNQTSYFSLLLHCFCLCFKLTFFPSCPSRK